MSVYKSRRKDANVLFIQATAELRETTIRICKKFPKSWWSILTRDCLKLISKAFNSCVKGNEIFMHKEMDKLDYKMRRKYFLKALTNVDALGSEITFCYTTIREEPIGMSKDDRERHFKNWSEQALKAKSLIKKILESDRERWKKWKQERKAKKNEAKNKKPDDIWTTK